MGDPEACERAATECDHAARQLDAPINRLLNLRGSAATGWVGDSLVTAVDTRRQSLVQAQGQLHDAASQLRSAATRLREVQRHPPGQRAMTTPRV
jgi:hypothetical protein